MLSDVPSSLATMTARKLPECWGHRGASAALPENTIASFTKAIRDGADGIETDIHVSKDEVLVMFHDSNLLRTTGSAGLISETAWYGGIEHLRTLKEPPQAIPTFPETLNLLMKDENCHVKLNIDCKATNDPDRLLFLMHQCISACSDWETALAPRIVLGLWHPCFIQPALKHVPYLRRSYIGLNPYTAKEYFWSHVDVFSMGFGSLCNSEGQSFLKECTQAGKEVLVWTVNREEEMMEAVRWNVKAILTDVPWTYLALRTKLEADYDRASQISRIFLWTTLRYYLVRLWWPLERYYLESLRGPFQKVPLLAA